MPNPIAVGDIIQIQPWWTYQEQAGTNVLHYVVATGSSAVTDEEIANALSSAWTQECRDLVGEDVVFQGLTTRILRPGFTFPTITSQPVTLPGTQGAGTLPGQVCGIITKVTGEGSRRGRGRIYCPFPPTEYLGADGNPNVAYRLKMQSYAEQVLVNNTVIGALGTATLRPIVANRPIPSLGRNITSWVVRKRFATQRRRGDYGSPNTSPFN